MEQNTSKAILPADVDALALRLTALEVLDCGEVDDCRYQLEGIEQDANDTTRAANVHLGSFYARETAELAKRGIEALQAQLRSVQP